MGPDFSGWATKANVKCSDGLTIMPHAFQRQNKMRVPLVWQHGHDDPENVLGHAILEDRAEGVYAHCYFNDSAKAVVAKGLVQHQDVNSLSIWANQLIKRAGSVLHGAIREVSLVLAGANPGALIETVAIAHSDGFDEDLEDELIFKFNEVVELVHSDDATEIVTADETQAEDDVSHAVVVSDPNLGDLVENEDIYNSMTAEKQGLLEFLVGAAIEATSSAAHSDMQETEDNANIGTKDTQDAITGKEGNDTMSHSNVFETKDETKAPYRLSHTDIEAILNDAKNSPNGLLSHAVNRFAEEHLEHGIEDIEVLFPDAKAIDDVPEFRKRRTEWVDVVLTGVRKSPFANIKTIWADLTFDEARAKGYVKGNMKKEEFFKVAKRVTSPTTIYKKQKLDRDDMLDITDFNVVLWLKGEMRIMLDEEIARSILMGDGRAADDEDKIDEEKLRPIATDSVVYTTTVNVNIDDASSSMQEVIDKLILNRQHLRGTGLPTLFTTETYISRLMLLKDTTGRDLYRSLEEISTKLRVSRIVPVEALEEYSDIVAILVNPIDYVVGANKGGEVTTFEDFDIDYNQHKYLIETRISGALVKLKAALVLNRVEGDVTLVTPNEPTFVSSTGVVTIVATTGIVYKDEDGSTLSAGAQAALDPGESLEVYAHPSSSSYALEDSEHAYWKFTRPEA